MYKARKASPHCWPLIVVRRRWASFGDLHRDAAPRPILTLHPTTEREAPNIRPARHEVSLPGPREELRPARGRETGRARGGHVHARRPAEGCRATSGHSASRDPPRRPEASPGVGAEGRAGPRVTEAGPRPASPGRPVLPPSRRAAGRGGREGRAGPARQAAGGARPGGTARSPPATPRVVAGSADAPRAGPAGGWRGVRAGRAAAGSRVSVPARGVGAPATHGRPGGLRPGPGTMSARAPVPAARPREDPPTVAADREALLVAQPPGPERDGEEAAREERAAAATSAGARGEPSPAPVRGHSVPQAAVPVRPLALHLAHKARGPGGPFGLEPPPPPPRDVPAEDAPAPAGPEDKLPPPPKENPWTRRPPPCAAVTGAPAAPDVPVAELSSPKIIKTGKVKTKKSNKASDFSDMANWPTPGELVSTGSQSTINQGNKKSQIRKEKEEKIEKRSNSESKENREAKVDGLGENISEDEAQSSNQRKKANKHKWVPLHLDDVRPDSQERPGSRNSSRCQPEANKSAHNNRRNDTRSKLHSKRKMSNERT
uniref:Collagen alpha-1(I) chain-like n=1 Tax=Castor canadensis TaxID=51338 RepID=A0A8B7U298_CASCN|nr:collagen alpha-1(I) chain-like [Castor canadensis]